jgi:hypothetical protein
MAEDLKARGGMKSTASFAEPEPDPGVPEQGTGKYGFVCNKFPSYSIGKDVKFDHGVFETNSAKIAAIVKNHEWYKVHIHDR